jgi:hypothetical protein
MLQFEKVGFLLSRNFTRQAFQSANILCNPEHIAMTIVSPPLSPHIGVDDVSSSKKRLYLSGFSTMTPFCDVKYDIDASSLFSRSNDDVSMVYCLPCVAGQRLPVQLTKQQRFCHLKQRGGRAVSFVLSTNQEFESLHHLDYSAEEFRATWYSRQELNEMKKARRTLLQRMDFASTNVPNWEQVEETCIDPCARGLEGQTKIGRHQRNAETAAVVAAVLDEEEAQYARGILEVNAIAYICEKALSRRARDSVDNRQSSLLMNNLLEICITPNTIIIVFDTYFQHYSLKAANGTKESTRNSGRYQRQQDRP